MNIPKFNSNYLLDCVFSANFQFGMLFDQSGISVDFE